MIRSCLAVLLAAGLQSAVAAEKPPNVVLIISDDHAWTDYSSNGHPHIRTPHIDGLAAQGLTYRRGYVPSSLCSPSLASILTGRYAHQHKVTSNDPPLPPGKTGQAAYDDPAFRAQRKEMVRFIETIPTIPRLLAKQGYVSFESGKWWGGNFQSGGFTSGMTHGDPDHGGRHGDVGLTIGRETMKPVFDFIDESTESGKPFFLWYAPMMPHQPHNPPARLLDKYRDKAPSLDVAKYWAMVEWFDETCGQLLDHLDAKGVANDTLVVYLSDNGWIQDPAAPRYAPRSKQSQYDGGLRTPIILRWPGKIQPGESDRLASSIDLAPTILTAAGVKPAPEMPGVNLLDASAVKAREAIFGEIFTHNSVDIHRPSTSLRYRWTIAGDWKLILPARQNEPDAPIELYNLASDPAESKNLAEQNPSKVAELSRLADDWWTPG
ncbi:MAG: sulfatase [Paludisphaera borealis]|uniref:sulfatase family protein n=1 Tax=Paludisphaera borealis TaxID=1387353 RepID=UPI00284EDDCE|nr:sulfatase [Paludisphaera borealis]MDR3621235.1 sulfatase [Paludisphaera borealis]